MIPFSEALERYERYAKLEKKEITVTRYQNDLRQLCLLLRNPNIGSITADDILKLFELMTQLGWTKNGIYKKSYAYKSFFKFLQTHGYQSLNPDRIPRLRMEFVPPRIASEEEYQKLLTVMPKKGLIHIRNNAMIRMFWDTGMRNGEVTALNVSDIPSKALTAGSKRFYSTTIRTEKSRGHSPVRQVFWTEETHDALKKWLKARAEYEKKYTLLNPEALFFGATNNGIGRRLTPHAVDIILRKYSKAAKIPTMNAHAFRHAKARRVVEQGGTNSDVMNILGHASMESSRVYTLLYGTDLQQRAEKFL